MAKLIKNADGSISFVLDDTKPEEAKAKQLRQAKIDADAAKGKYAGKSIKDLAPADKDALLDILLRLHGLI